MLFLFFLFWGHTSWCSGNITGTLLRSDPLGSQETTWCQDLNQSQQPTRKVPPVLSFWPLYELSDLTIMFHQVDAQRTWPCSVSQLQYSITSWKDTLFVNPVRKWHVHDKVIKLCLRKINKFLTVLRDFLPPHPPLEFHKLDHLCLNVDPCVSTIISTIDKGLKGYKNFNSLKAWNVRCGSF